ncbi:MAG: hypothetical protein WBO10_10220 [Pyrinomonadaceae bacterium]
MKKQMLVILTVLMAVLLGVGVVAAQDAKKMDKDKMMDMDDMKSGPHHSVMMAYKQNVLTFAKALRDMSKGGKLADADLARNAFAEIKQSMEKMDAIQKSHMSKMSPEMREKMKPMMEKMKADQVTVKEQILALDKAFQSDSPDASAVEKHAAALVSQLEKMSMPDKKKEMPDKMKH